MSNLMGENAGGIERKGVQSVDRAFEILRAFDRNEQSLGVKEIAAETGMAPSQVHHYLVSLVRSGAVRQLQNGTYALGTFMLQAGLSALRRLDPVERTLQAARAFRDETQEATFVSLWGGHGATIIRFFEGVKPVTVAIRTGGTMPLLGSATGHVFLTWLPSARLMLESTESDSLNLETIQQKTQEAGLGHVNGLLLPSIAALSAPVFDRDNMLAFSLTTMGWASEFDHSLDGSLANKLREAAKNLSLDLGQLR